MKAYYEDESAIIYHGDCREIMPTIEPYEVIIVDAPYGINYLSGRRFLTKSVPITGDNKFPLYVFDWEPSIALFVWCRWEMLDFMPVPKSFIVWDKMNHSGGDLKHSFARRWEGCAFYPGIDHVFINGRPKDIVQYPRVDYKTKDYVHPAQKPVNVIKHLLFNHDGLVIDPFMGSGSTLLAAKELGRKSIGIEIEEQYCEIAANRLYSSDVIEGNRIN